MLCWLIAETLEKLNQADDVMGRSVLPYMSGSLTEVFWWPQFLSPKDKFYRGL